MTGLFSPAFISISPGPTEMLFVGVVILLLFGSKNVPKIARTLGRTLEEFRRAARDVSDEIMRSDPDIANEPRRASLPEPETATERDKDDQAPPDEPAENPPGSEARTP